MLEKSSVIKFMEVSVMVSFFLLDLLAIIDYYRSEGVLIEPPVNQPQCYLHYR